MFSYLHRYHAGNFADVHKHLVLTAILTTLHKKVTPFCVLDTHAGEGIYTLHSREIQKNAEYKKGFYPLLKAPSPPPLIQRFLNIITKEEKAYPGSPAFIHAFLRQTDRAILIEGHPQSFLHLKSWAKYKKNLSLHDRDSLEGLKALVPFKEKRGLVFIDPSYEVKTEYKEVGEALEAAFSRFSNGIYALWYPLLPTQAHETLLRKIKKCHFKSIWCSEWIPDPEKTTGLYGSGMIIINPPWQVDKMVTQAFSWMRQHIFKEGQFSCRK